MIKKVGRITQEMMVHMLDKVYMQTINAPVAKRSPAIKR